MRYGSAGLGPLGSAHKRHRSRSKKTVTPGCCSLPEPSYQPFGKSTTIDDMGLVVEYGNYVLVAVVLAILIRAVSRPGKAITRNGEPLR